jgi:hypothetical protein
MGKKTYDVYPSVCALESLVKTRLPNSARIWIKKPGQSAKKDSKLFDSAPAVKSQVPCHRDPRSLKSCPSLL